MRGRIRTIKPEFFTHEELFDLESALGLPVRIAFVGLWCYADREGRFEWRPRRLRACILPYEDILCFDRILDGLAAKGFVTKYAVDGVDYGVIDGFCAHQRPSREEPPSNIPAPDGSVSNYSVLSDETRAEVYARDTNMCLYCTTDVGGSHTRKRCLDHVIPYSRGGSNEPENLATACKACNSKKGDKTPDEASMPWPEVDGVRLGATVSRSRPDGTVNPPVNPPVRRVERTVNNGNGTGTERNGTEDVVENSDHPEDESDDPSPSPVQLVFDHWRAVMGKTQAAKLDGKRRRRCEWAIREYGLDVAKRAIDGCARSDWHMGRDPKSGGASYNDLTLVFRDAVHLERFRDMATGQANAGAWRPPVTAEAYAASASTPEDDAAALAALSADDLARLERWSGGAHARR